MRPASQLTPNLVVLPSALAQNNAPVTFTDADSGIIFNSWGIANGGAQTKGGFQFGVALPEDALENDASEFLGYLVRSEEPEEPPLFFMHAVVFVVQDGGHAAHHLAVAPGQKGLHFGDFVEGMFLPTEQLLQVVAERGNPVGIVAIKLPRELHERPTIPPGSHRGHGDIRHRTSLWHRR